MEKKNTRRNVIESLAWAVFLTIPFAAISSYGQHGDHKAFREAVELCAKENNITLPKPPAPGSGERPKPPSEENRKVIDACLTAKGIALPAHHHGPPGPPPPPPEEDKGGPAQE